MRLDTGESTADSPVPAESERHAGRDVDEPGQTQSPLRTPLCLPNRSGMQAATWTSRDRPRA